MRERPSRKLLFYQADYSGETFDDMGLGLTQKQYNVLKEKFEEWEKAQVRGK